MTREELLKHLLERFGRAEGPDVFSADEIRLWPDGTHAALVAAGILKRMPSARVIECDGCERNCFKPVQVRKRPAGQGAAAFIICDEPEDFGRIPVELMRLEQWQAVGGVGASILAQTLDCPIPPELAARMPRQSGRDAAIKAKYAEILQLGERNYIKEIRRAVPGAQKLSDRRIRAIVKGR
jgi:hypothetical protein